jgi:tetratricopeptide (TPR) repeat protein
VFAGLATGFVTGTALFTLEFPSDKRWRAGFSATAGLALFGFVWVLAPYWFKSRPQEHQPPASSSKNGQGKLGPQAISQESITKAGPNEALVLVFRPTGAAEASNLTETIAGSLQSELSNAIAPTVNAAFDTWRIETIPTAANPTEADTWGKNLGALFVITGHYDGANTVLRIRVTKSDLLINPESAQLALRLDADITQISATAKELTAKLGITARFLRAMQFYFNSEFQKCEKYLDDILADKASTDLAPRAYYMRGACRFYSRRIDPSIADYSQAEALGFRVAPVYWRRAQAELLKLNFDKADADLKAGLKLTDHSALGFLTSAVLTVEVLDYTSHVFGFAFKEQPQIFDKADDFFRVASEKDPKLVRAVLDRMRMYERYGEYLGKDVYGIANAFLNDAAQKNPESIDIRLALAKLNDRHKKYAEALKYFKEARALGMDEAPFSFAAAQLCEAQSLTEEARKYWKSYLDTSDKEPGWWFRRAFARASLVALTEGSKRQLLEPVLQEEASTRRKAFIAYARGWKGKLWESGFYGKRSTLDFVAFALSEQGILPKTGDYDSSFQLFSQMLTQEYTSRPNPEEKNAGSKLEPPFWIRGLMNKPDLLAIERTWNGDTKSYVYVCLRIDGDRGEPVIEETIDAGGPEFFFCYPSLRAIRMDLKASVTGDY